MTHLVDASSREGLNPHITPAMITGARRNQFLRSAFGAVVPAVANVAAVLTGIPVSYLLAGNIGVMVSAAVSEARESRFGRDFTAATAGGFSSLSAVGAVYLENVAETSLPVGVSDGLMGVLALVTSGGCALASAHCIPDGPSRRITRATRQGAGVGIMAGSAASFVGTLIALRSFPSL